MIKMNAEQNTESKNRNSKHERMLRGWGYLCALSIFGAWIFAVYKQNVSSREKYIVKDKIAQKIYYAPITAQYDVHVMQCDTFSLDSILYNCINIGDTILGRKVVLDDTNSTASYADMYATYRISNIHSINGKDLTQLDKTYFVGLLRNSMTKQNNGRQ